MRPVVFHPEASREHTEAIEYYAAASLELGERLNSEIQRLVSEVSRDPQRFFRFHPPARRALSREFPYSVVYLEEPVMHAKRRPDYWRKRLG